MEDCKFAVRFMNKSVPCEYVTDIQRTKNILEYWRVKCKDKLFGLDTETAALPHTKHINQAALSPHLATIRLLQIYDGVTSYIFDLYVIPPWVFRKFLAEHRFVAHNALFDLMFINKWILGGTPPDGRKPRKIAKMNIACTYILFKILTHATQPVDSGLRASLGALAAGLLHTDIVKEMGQTDWSVPELTFEQIEYAAVDAVAVWYLAKKMAPSITRFGLERYWNLIKKAHHPIADMQLTGIMFNVDKHRDMVQVWRKELYEAKKRLLKITGLEKITAHTVADYLSKNLGSQLLEVWPRTETGKLKTDAATLYDYADVSPVVAPFAEFQKKEKLTTSFGNTLLSLVNPITGRLHASYRICGARTGRLSCSNPNLQQAPREASFRDNFIASPGKCFVLADYSSVEVRIAAEVSKDPNMLNVFSEGIDIYKYVASHLNDKSIDDISKEERTASKALVLGLQFGLSHKKFGQYARKNYKVDIDDEEASHRVQKYRKLFPVFREWQYTEIQQAVINKYTSRTPFGKLRRYDPDNAYGNVLNHKIQGGAAEAVLCAMIHVHNNLPMDAHLVASVHDELVIECPEGKVEEIKDLLEKCMRIGYSNVFTSGKTTKKLVEAHIGNTWGEAKV